MTTTSRRPAPVDRAGEHLVAGRLVDRQRLAGDRRLVHGALAGRDAAVERNLLAGPTSTVSPTRTSSTGDARTPSRRADERLAGRQVHQRADRVARAIHRARLEQLREREQEDDRCRLGPLRQMRSRRSDRDHHQHVDVEARPRGPTRARGARYRCRRERPRRGQQHPRERRVDSQNGARAPSRRRMRRPRAATSRRRQTPRRRSARVPRARATRACPSGRPLRQCAPSTGRAASYLMRRRWPITSASSASSPCSFFRRRSRIATSSWQSIPSILKVDSACSSQTVQLAIVVEVACSWTCVSACFSSSRMCWSSTRVVHQASGAPRTHEPHAAQEAQLVRDGRFADADVRGDVADAQLAATTARRGCARGSGRRARGTSRPALRRRAATSAAPSRLTGANLVACRHRSSHC